MPIKNVDITGFEMTILTIKLDFYNKIKNLLKKGWQIYLKEVNLYMLGGDEYVKSIRKVL